MFKSSLTLCSIDMDLNIENMQSDRQAAEWKGTSIMSRMPNMRLFLSYFQHKKWMLLIFFNGFSKFTSILKWCNSTQQTCIIITWARHNNKTTNACTTQLMVEVRNNMVGGQVLWVGVYGGISQGWRPREIPMPIKTQEIQRYSVSTRVNTQRVSD